MKPGVAIAPRPTSGRIAGALQTQTPSRAEHGPEGVSIFRPAFHAYRNTSRLPLGLTRKRLSPSLLAPILISLHALTSKRKDEEE